MTESSAPRSRAEKLLPPQVQEELRQAFAVLPHDIPLLLFTGPAQAPEEIETARDLAAAFQLVTDKIKFREHSLDSPEAAKWGVTTAPVFVFAPERYSIRYLGVPLGEEGRTLVETLILIGLGQSRLKPQTLKVLEKIDSPRQVMVFVSPTCPYCPQQAVNAVKAAIARPGLISVDIVDTGFNADLADRYAAYSVPQTFADDILIAKGAQPEELFAASLEQMEEAAYFIPEQDAPRVETDLVIVGGGPAGLTAAIYAARSGLKAVIIERDQLGGQVATTPVVENYPGLARIGGKNLVDIMAAHALEYVDIFLREEVREIRTGDPIEITTSLRTFTARAVLLATGAVHRKLDAPGEERFAGRGVSYCSTCDGPLFKGKKVAVAGGGNSAVTEALHLRHLGVDVTLIHRRDALRAQEHLVHDLEQAGIPVLWNTEIREIRGHEKMEELVLHDKQAGRTETRPFDGLFVSIGYQPQTGLARELGLEITGDGYIRHDELHRTSLPGVYSAGDVEGGYKQIVTAAGAGAAAAMTIFEDLTHPYWKDRQA